MIVKEGLSYRTNLGRKIGPVAILPGGMVVTSEESNVWDLHGRRYGRNYLDSEFLLEEWKDSPIRTVTRKEIVAGTYGRLYVEPSTSPKKVNVNFNDKDGKIFSMGLNCHLDSSELREAAHILNQIAEALEDD